MIPRFALITVVRVERMASALIAVGLAGAYGTQRSIADVFVAIAFGLFGYVARRNGFPPVPVIIGLILGSLVEKSFRQALQISGGNYLTFVTHPMSAVILFCCVAMLALPGFIPNPIDPNLRPASRRRRAVRTTPAEAPNGARRKCGVAKRAEVRAGD